MFIKKSNINICIGGGFMEDNNSIKTVNCNNCNNEVPVEKKFCTQCGNSMIAKPDSSSKSISDELERRRNASKYSSATSPTTVDETLDSIKDSGKDLIKGIGSFLNKNISSNDNFGMNNPNEITNIPKKIIKRKPGYLVCTSCGGYYELQNDEKPDDFSDECECGGTLEHQINLSD